MDVCDKTVTQFVGVTEERLKVLEAHERLSWFVTVRVKDRLSPGCALTVAGDMLIRGNVVTQGGVTVALADTLVVDDASATLASTEYVAGCVPIGTTFDIV